MQGFQLLVTLLLSLFLLGSTTSTEVPITKTSDTVIEESTSHANSISSSTTTSQTTSSVVSSTIVGSTAVASTTTDSPSTTDICGLSLVSQSEQEMARNRKCTCNGFNEEVDCSYLDISSLPKLISFPKSVREVNFVGNKIENIAEDTFYNGRSVLDLDLSHNRIDFISIVAFKGFKSLKRLDLSHNKIWNVPPKSFEGLSSLRVLNLGFNDIAVLSPDLFNAVPNLMELDLESNPLLELEPKLFEHLKYLETLNLGSTLLKVIPDHLFVFTPHLKKLDLSSNQLTSIPTDALKYLDRLATLQLSGNPVSVIKEEAFMGMRGLVVLYLDRMPLLTKIEKYAFGDLQNLQELQCSYNFLLSEIDEKAFVKKTNNMKVGLSQLFLRQNSLFTLSQKLLDWNQNVELHITDNPISCDCNAEWMIHLKLKNEFQKHVKCYTPSHLADFTLEQLKEGELSCGLELTEIVMIILAAVVFLLILILIIAFLVWRRSYSGYSKPYFRVSKKKNIDMYDRGDDDI